VVTENQTESARAATGRLDRLTFNRKGGARNAAFPKSICCTPIALPGANTRYTQAKDSRAIRLGASSRLASGKSERTPSLAEQTRQRRRSREHVR
jgi:hypothetical protein